MHPSSLKAFQRDEECDMNQPGLVDLISTNKTKQNLISTNKTKQNKAIKTRWPYQ